MAGSKRVLGLSRAFAPGAVACVALGIGACDATPDLHSSPVQDTSGVGGVVGTDPLPPTAGGISVSGPCGVGGFGGVSGGQSASTVFQAQAISPSSPARRELYSWTTDEQAAALRSDQVLFTQSEQAGLGPGYAFTYLNQLATSATDPQQQQLASLLGGDLFAKKRYAWPEPWATRMGWPGENYGGNLLRILLKPEAWLVIMSSGQLSVVDLANQPVATSEALLHPARIGAILYVKDGAAGGPSCNGSFSAGANGYREFILGNLAMVEEWSIGTQQIHDRLTANIAYLNRFFTQLRTCPPPFSASQWNLQVVCSWVSDPIPGDETLSYELALAIPSSNYLPLPQQIATIIETLQGDLFEPNPLVVKPGSP